jgi:hypothetical protein
MRCDAVGDAKGQPMRYPGKRADVDAVVAKRLRFVEPEWYRTIDAMCVSKTAQPVVKEAVRKTQRKRN